MLFIISAQIQWDIIPKPRPSWKRNFGNVVTINTNTEAQSDKVGNDLWHNLVQSLLLQCQLELTRTISFVNNPGVVNSKTQDNLFQILVILIDKKLFPDVHRELSASLFVLTASCPVPGHQWKESDSIFFVLSLRAFLYISKNPLSLSFWTIPPHSAFFMEVMLLTIFVTLHWTLSNLTLCLYYWGGQNWTQDSSCDLISNE